MSCMRDVRKRSDRTDTMFEPLRETVAALQGAGVALPDGVLRQVCFLVMALAIWRPDMLNSAHAQQNAHAQLNYSLNQLPLPAPRLSTPRRAGRASRRRSSTGARPWRLCSKPRRWTCGARAMPSASAWRNTGSELAIKQYGYSKCCFIPCTQVLCAALAHSITLLATCAWSRFFLKRAPFSISGGGELKLEHLKPAYQVQTLAILACVHCAVHGYY